MKTIWHIEYSTIKGNQWRIIFWEGFATRKAAQNAVRLWGDASARKYRVVKYVKANDQGQLRREEAL